MTQTRWHASRAALFPLLTASLLAGCGGDSTPPSSGPINREPPTGASVAGTATGIVAGRPIAVTNSSGEALTLTTDGAFRFQNQLDFNGTYRVTVSSGSPDQACSVLFGSGSAATGFDHVQVICGPTQQSAFRTAAPLRSPRERHLQITSADGSVLVFGGDDLTTTGISATEVRAIERYDPVADRWNAAGTLPVGIHVAQALALPTGRIVLLATQPQLPASTVQAYLYDPATTTLTPKASAATLTMADTAVTMFTGQLMVSDGTTLELYDAGVDRWFSVDAFRARHLNGTLTVIANGSVLAAGGFGTDGTPSAASEVFDAISHHWTTVGNLQAAREGMIATLLPNGRVLIVGGYNAAIGATPALPIATQAEQFDPTARSWLPAGSPTVAREGATTTLMPTGRVLLAGGNVQSVVQPITGVATLPTTVDTVESFDPQTSTWASFARLNAARTHHAAARMSDGTALIAGGYVSRPNVPQLGTAMDWTNALVGPSEIGY